MNDQKRRFRPRNQRSGFRPRNNNGQNSNGHFQSNGNIGRNNGSMTNPFNVEKTAQKYQQLAKDAANIWWSSFYTRITFNMQSTINRRLAELNYKPKQQNIEKSEPVNSTLAETVNTSEDKKQQFNFNYFFLN